MVRLYFGNGIAAEGEAQELATFYSCFLTKLNVLREIVKADKAAIESISQLISQTKIEIKKIDEEK